MNRFQHHHRQSITFAYSCFDRMILNGFIPAFQHSKRAGTIHWFLKTHRQAEQLNRKYFARLSGNYHKWVEAYAAANGIEIVIPEKKIRREQWVEPYFERLDGQPGIAVILKARERERIAIHLPSCNQLSVEWRNIDVYNFYLHDPQCGRMFLRICPYFPFNLRVWMNGHNWLAQQLTQAGIAFEKRDNLFTACADPERLQELSDAFAPADIMASVQTWLARLLPFFSESERQQGFRHQLFMGEMEYCHNLVFHKRAALDRLFDRLMDANRSIGHPDKLAVIFGRPCFRPDTRTGQTTLKITPLRTPVLSSSYKCTSIKQYVSNGQALRAESGTYQLKDLSVRKNINNLPQLRKVLNNANQRCLDVQQDILATYVDRGQLEELRRPSQTATGRRVPGMRVDDSRLMAVLQAITCLAYLAGKSCFRTRDLLVDVQKMLGNPQYRLSQLRYDLGKLRSKGLLMRLPKTQSYQISHEGYRIAILYLKLYQRLYAPLTAGIREPISTDNEVLRTRQTKLDRLYVAIDKALTALADHVGLANVNTEAA
jgi:hypothetical protein